MFGATLQAGVPAARSRRCPGVPLPVRARVEGIRCRGCGKGAVSPGPERRRSVITALRPAPRVKGHAAGRMLTESGWLPTCPRHAPCCRCATASASLRSAVQCRSSSSLFRRREGEELQCVGKIREGTARQSGEGPPGRVSAGKALPCKVMPRSRAAPQHEVSLTPGLRSGSEGNGVELITQRSGVRRAAEATDMTRAGEGARRFKEPSGPRRGG